MFLILIADCVCGWSDCLRRPWDWPTNPVCPERDAGQLHRTNSGSQGQHSPRLWPDSRHGRRKRHWGGTSQHTVAEPSLRVQQICLREPVKPMIWQCLPFGGCPVVKNKTRLQRSPAVWSKKCRAVNRIKRKKRKSCYIPDDVIIVVCSYSQGPRVTPIRKNT